MLKQLSIYAENKKGALQAMTNALYEAGINIWGSVTNDGAEYGSNRMVVSDPDKAKEVLTEKGYLVGLISEVRYQDLKTKERQIAEEIERVDHENIGGTEVVQKFLEAHESTLLKSGTTIGELVRRPELDYEMLAEIDKNRPQYSAGVREQVNINIKYQGYIRRQMKQVEQFKKMENKRIPKDINYDEVGSLRIEAVQKLKKFQPLSIGQASRISGVSPADISVLLVYLESRDRK